MNTNTTRYEVDGYIWIKTHNGHVETQWEMLGCPGLVVATHEDMIGRGQWGYGLFIPHEDIIPAIALFTNLDEAIRAGNAWFIENN